MLANVPRRVAPVSLFRLAEADAGYGNSSDADARLLRILPSCLQQHGSNDRLITRQTDAGSAYLPKRTGRHHFAVNILRFQPRFLRTREKERAKETSCHSGKTTKESLDQ